MDQYTAQSEGSKKLESRRAFLVAVTGVPLGLSGCLGSSSDTEDGSGDVEDGSDDTEDSSDGTEGSSDNTEDSSGDEEGGSSNETNYDLPAEVLGIGGEPVDEEESYTVEEARGAYNGEVVSFIFRVTNHREEETILNYLSVNLMSEGGNELAESRGQGSAALSPGETEKFEVEQSITESVSEEDVTGLAINLSLGE